MKLVYCKGRKQMSARKQSSKSKCKQQRAAALTRIIEGSKPKRTAVLSPEGNTSQLHVDGSGDGGGAKQVGTSGYVGTQ